MLLFGEGTLTVKFMKNILENCSYRNVFFLTTSSNPFLTFFVFRAATFHFEERIHWSSCPHLITSAYVSNDFTNVRKTNQVRQRIK